MFRRSSVKMPWTDFGDMLTTGHCGKAVVHDTTHIQSFYCSSGICPRLPRWAGTSKVKTRKVKPIWIYWSKRYWVAVASAGPYANLHLIPYRLPRQHPTTQFFTGQMPFLPPNQQCQSTVGPALKGVQCYNVLDKLRLSFMWVDKVFCLFC